MKDVEAILGLISMEYGDRNPSMNKEHGEQNLAKWNETYSVVLFNWELKVHCSWSGSCNTEL